MRVWTCVRPGGKFSGATLFRKLSLNHSMFSVSVFVLSLNCNLLLT